jgi:hypothetical protein
MEMKELLRKLDLGSSVAEFDPHLTATSMRLRLSKGWPATKQTLLLARRVQAKRRCFVSSNNDTQRFLI